jgi:hypothetical protein
MTRASILLAALLVQAMPLAAAPPKIARPLPNVQVAGEVQNNTLTVTSPTATFVLGGDALPEHYRLTAEVQLAPKAGGTYLQVMPSDPWDFNKSAALYASIGRDGAGRLLQTSTSRFDSAGGKWIGNADVTYWTYWPAPTDKATLALVADPSRPRSWKNRWLRLRVEVDKQHIACWLDGRLLRQVDRPAGARGPVSLKMEQGARVRQVEVRPLEAASRYLPIDLATHANDQFAAPLGKHVLTADGVPFELKSGGADHVNLRHAQWIEAKTDPADYYERYDGGPPILHDGRMPMFRVPLADYTAAHLLAVADDDTDVSPALTIRAGRYGWAEQVVQHDYPGRVPRRKEAGPSVDTPAGKLFHVRVPMTEACAQDLKDFLEFELTKEVRLARRRPDPCRFRLRPLGLPSGVRIAALTLERSPLQMRVTSSESGHAFVEPQKPAFKVHLRNITSEPQPGALALTATHLDGTRTEATRTLQPIAPGAAVDVAIELPAAKRGYHDLRVSLRDGAGQTLLERRTSFALLPPDTRKHRDTSPFGTWDFSGGHFTSNNADEVGPLYVKMGLRHGMFGFKPAERRKYGVLQGNEPNVFAGGVKAFEDYQKAHPDALPVALIFHETAISGKHLSRIPDLFHDGAPYKLDAAEEKQFKTLWDQATASARAIKAKYPKVHLRFGNGPLPVKEEFYRRKFPAELFDSAGNESGSFGRMPEAQPPDCVAYNASIWMDRQMLDAYGYKDKPVTECLEICYPGSNPGNLSLRTQADYFIRHALHGLAWQLPQQKIGCLSDMGNSYYFSNWGATGFCRSKPELNVKPAFVAMATLTRVLDGAAFVRVVPMGSPSLYGLEFRRPDGSSAFAFWTVRGKRPVHLQGEEDDKSPPQWILIDSQGSETKLTATAKKVALTLTSSPVYVVGAGRLSAVEPGQPVYDDKPPARHTVLASLADLKDWTVQEGRDAELEYYDFMCLRRRGDFAFEPAANFEGQNGVLRVTPRPIKHGKDTMPMYGALVHRTGIAIPGTPTEIGLWVNGNSGWGRPIFELEDASGQRWISLGAEQADVPRSWIEDGIPRDMLAKFPRPAVSDWNTEDVYGISRINFDGWRYLSFPLPGNYPGDKYPWPANSQWRWDRDGVVHYPLKFKRLILELPEKVLQVKTFAPPPRPAVYLKDLSAGQDDKALSQPRTTE